MSNITTTGNSAFSSCSSLTSLDLPALTTAGSSAFSSCSKVTSVNMPNLTSIGSGCFGSCYALTSLTLPAIENVNATAFSSLRACKTIDVIPETYQGGALPVNLCNNDYVLTAFIIRYTGGVVAMSNTNVFANCYHILGTKNTTYNPQSLKDGYIYVPDALVDEYKAADNWSTYADQIKPLSELPTE